MKHHFQDKKAVVLLSGGLDSAVSLFIAKKAGFLAHCLCFDYGQRHKREIVSAKAIAKKAGAEFFKVGLKLDLRGSSLTNCKLSLPKAKHKTLSEERGSIPSTYVPGRNIVFLSIAASIAETIGAEAIFIGANALDYSGYPDCRPEFISLFNKMLKKGTRAGTQGRGILVRAPLLKKTKSQIVELARKLKVPLELTWSCYKGGRVPCRECEACVLRKRGFDSAQVKDPVVK